MLHASADQNYLKSDPLVDIFRKKREWWTTVN